MTFEVFLLVLNEEGFRVHKQHCTIEAENQGDAIAQVAAGEVEPIRFNLKPADMLMCSAFASLPQETEEDDQAQQHLHDHLQTVIHGPDAGRLAEEHERRIREQQQNPKPKDQLPTPPTTTPTKG
jgi:hypothetical protein